VFTGCEHLKRIEAGALGGKTNPIGLPASLEFVHPTAFSDWSKVRFEPGGRCVKAEVGVVSGDGTELFFCLCTRLSQRVFESGLDFVTIKPKAFVLCTDMDSIVLPASVEILEEGCFEGNGVRYVPEYQRQ
jgi:hypothetical protein